MQLSYNLLTFFYNNFTIQLTFNLLTSIYNYFPLTCNLLTSCLRVDINENQYLNNSMTINLSIINLSTINLSTLIVEFFGQRRDLALQL
jgi:hypothetical protein